MLNYFFGFIALSSFLVKLYIKFTTGRYKINEDLTGKVVLITGPTAGIGKETAYELAKAGATVHLLCRNKVKGEKLAKELWRTTDNSKVFVHQVDMCSFSSIRHFVEKFLKTDHQIDILINNAGLMANVQNLTEDGCDETMQANYFGHFLLTNLLLERMKTNVSPCRIVNVSSMGHRWTKDFDITDLNFKYTKYSPWNAYMWSKLCNVLFTFELANRIRGTNITTYSLHPGAVRTDILKGQPLYMWPFVLLPMPFMKSCSEGAQTTLYVALAKEVKHVSGCYFSDCKPEAPCLLALDERLAKDLWVETEKIVSSKAALNKS